MSRYFIIHKPFKVLSQFTDEGGNEGLSHFFNVPRDVYPIGRLDLDSEGLLILSNDKKLNDRLLNPKYAHERTYWALVEGIPNEQSLKKFRTGLDINLGKGRSHRTMPAKIKVIEANISERIPPVNYTKSENHSWLEIKLIEGKNRQVRKMTASIGHPTLRLIRVAIENLFLGSLESGGISEMSAHEIGKKLKISL